MRSDYVVLMIVAFSVALMFALVRITELDRVTIVAVSSVVLGGSLAVHVAFLKRKRKRAVELMREIVAQGGVCDPEAPVREQESSQ